jgi:3-methyladenine DNA glycosylase AlkD
MIDVPELVTEKQMESWAMDFDSWDVCDQVCSNLFDKTGFAYQKAMIGILSGNLLTGTSANREAESNFK